MAAFETAAAWLELLWSSAATLPPVVSASSACLLIRLDLSSLSVSVSLSLFSPGLRCFALLSLCSFVSHPFTWWLLLSHTSSLVLQPEG